MRSRRVYAVLLSTSMFVACSSPPSSPADTVDADVAAVDATSSADAAIDSSSNVCAPLDVAVTAVTIENAAPMTTLTLDGVGSRCEQLARAVLDPQQRPPQLASLEPSPDSESPLCVEGAQQDAVMITINRIMGKPLYSGGEWIRAWVRKSDSVITQLDGWYLSTPSATPVGCASESTLTDGVIGYEREASLFQFCAPYGTTTWTVAANDERWVGGSGWFYDGKNLVAARELEIGVGDANMNQKLLDSDLNCCGVVDEQRGCVGVVLYVDANSGKILGDRRRCLVC